MKTAIITMQRDTERYIEEWALYHRMTGWDYILLYDHDSKPAMQEKCVELHRRNVLSYEGPVFWKDGDPNLHPAVANMGLTRARELGVDWVAVIDDDEFIEPVGARTIRPVLESMDATGVDFVTMNWLWHGSGEGEGPVIERITSCAEWNHPLNRWVKPIFRPSSFGPMFSIHCPGSPIIGTAGPIIGLHDGVHPWNGATGSQADPSYENLCLHHYKYRSREEWDRQSQRAYPGDPGKISREFRYDPSMDATSNYWASRFLPKLRNLIANRAEFAKIPNHAEGSF